MQWVRRFYCSRFRHSFGADLIYKRTSADNHSSSWDLFALCVGGMMVRLSGSDSPVRGCLSAVPVPTVLEPVISKSDNAVGLERSSSSNSYLVNNSNPLNGAPGRCDFNSTFSDDELSQIYASPDYLIFPIFTPSKDFIYGLARWLVLSLGTSSVGSARPRPVSSWLNNANSNDTKPLERVHEHQMSNKSFDQEFDKSFQREPEVSEFDISAECLNELKEFSKNYASDFCIQIRR